jgi:hypothetical protein
MCLLLSIYTPLIPVLFSADACRLPQIHSDIYKSFSLSISKGFNVYDLIQLDHIMILTGTWGAFVITII